MSCSWGKLLFCYNKLNINWRDWDCEELLCVAPVGKRLTHISNIRRMKWYWKSCFWLDVMIRKVFFFLAKSQTAWQRLNCGHTCFYTISHTCWLSFCRRELEKRSVQLWRQIYYLLKNSLTPAADSKAHIQSSFCNETWGQIVKIESFSCDFSIDFILLLTHLLWCLCRQTWRLCCKSDDVWFAWPVVCRHTLTCFLSLPFMCVHVSACLPGWVVQRRWGCRLCSGRTPALLPV